MSINLYLDKGLPGEKFSQDEKPLIFHSIHFEMRGFFKMKNLSYITLFILKHLSMERTSQIRKLSSVANFLMFLFHNFTVLRYKLKNIEETEAAKKLLQEKRLMGKARTESSIPSSYSADYFQRGKDYAEKLRRGRLRLLLPTSLLSCLMIKVPFV